MLKLLSSIWKGEKKVVSRRNIIVRRHNEHAAEEEEEEAAAEIVLRHLYLKEDDVILRCLTSRYNDR